MEVLLSSSKTLFLTLHALPALPHTPQEYLWLRLPHHSHLMFICVLYRPPNSDDYIYISLAENMDQLLSSHPKSLFLICGDFNCHHASWLGVGTSLTCHGTSERLLRLIGADTICQLPDPDHSQWYSISSGFGFDQFPCKCLLFFLCLNRLI